MNDLLDPTQLNILYHDLIRSDFKYVIIVFLLFIAPRIFVRFGLPLAITSFLLGIAAKHFGIDDFASEPALNSLSIIGISSLFLYAGLEVDILDLAANWKTLTEHIIVRLILILVLVYALTFYFPQYPIVAILLISLVLLTPSTGFILDSLPAIKMGDNQTYWIRNKSIAAELVALALLFFATQSSSTSQVFTSTALLLSIILILPIFLGPIFRFINKYAPNSEFGYLILIATLVAILTKKLGAYYLVGAFIVGVVASRLRTKETPFNSQGIFWSVKSFTSLFVPFYFFSAGLNIKTDMLSYKSVNFGLTLLLLVVPLRLFAIIIHRRLRLKEQVKQSAPIAIALMPNLVFGLVIIELLEQTLHVESKVLGALLIYTLCVSILPSWVLRWIKSDQTLATLSDKQLEIQTPLED